MALPYLHQVAPPPVHSLGRLGARAADHPAGLSARVRCIPARPRVDPDPGILGGKHRFWMHFLKLAWSRCMAWPRIPKTIFR